jgi:hypothetical protein
VQQFTELLKKLRQSPAARQAEEQEAAFHPSGVVDAGKAELARYGGRPGALCALVNQD